MFLRREGAAKKPRLKRLLNWQVQEGIEQTSAGARRGTSEEFKLLHGHLIIIVLLVFIPQKREGCEKLTSTWIIH